LNDANETKCNTELIPQDKAKAGKLDDVAQQVITHSDTKALPNAAVSHYLMEVKPNYYWSMRIKSDAYCHCGCSIYIEGKQVYAPNGAFSDVEKTVSFNSLTQYQELQFQFKDLNEGLEDTVQKSELARLSFMKNGLGTIRVSIKKKLESVVIPNLPVVKQDIDEKTVLENDSIAKYYESKDDATPTNVYKYLQVGMQCTVNASSSRSTPQPQFLNCITSCPESFEEQFFYYRSDVSMHCEKFLLNMKQLQAVPIENAIYISDNDAEEDEDNGNESCTSYIGSNNMASKKSQGGRKRPYSSAPSGASFSASSSSVNHKAKRQQPMSECSHHKCSLSAKLYCKLCKESYCAVHMHRMHKFKEVEQEHASAVIPFNERNTN